MPPSSTASQQTLDQRRAAHAWAAVARIKDQPAGKKYGQQAKKLPMRIMTSGLGQALTFLHAKKYAPELLQDLGEWVLIKRDNPISADTTLSPDELIKKIIGGDNLFLRRSTEEALAYLQWLARFVEAEELTEGDD